MDKKNLLLGVGCIGLALYLMFTQAARQSEQFEQQQATEEERGRLIDEVEATESEPVARQTPEPGSLATVAAEQPFDRAEAADVPSAVTEHSEPTAGGLARPAAVTPPAPAEREVERQPGEQHVLENEFIRVTFTTRGGSIKSVALLKYPAEQGSEEPFIFNEVAEVPALAISLAGRDGIPQPYDANFRMVRKEADSILFAYEEGGLEVRRGYQLSPRGKGDLDPYVIQHETAFHNASGQALDLGRFFLNTGTSLPTPGDLWGEYLSFGYQSHGKSKFLSISRFRGRGGFLGIGFRPQTDLIVEGPMPVEWVTVKNQFFAAVLTPSRPGTGIFSKTVDLSGEIADSSMRQALTGDIEFSIGRIDPGQRELLGVQYYVGPKEFTRLQALGDPSAGYAGGQDAVMQFGFFGFISKILLVLMIGVHGVIGPISPTWGWGWTIILVTVLIKACLWPLTAAQVRSARRMTKIQAPLKELREKYKDSPQKVQQETMKLFREHKVNPVAGCLPLLVQIPIFIGLFFMLRTASELRFAEFLWIHDLSLPDTIAVIAGFPVNILPLFMAVSMFFQMRMTPMPTADNIQRKIFQLMPFIFLIFCYNFPSGLVLYWTTQNLLTILQTWLTNRRRDEIEAAVATTEAAKPKTPARPGAKGAKKKAGKPKK